MSNEVVPVPAKWAKRARINAEGYTAAVRGICVRHHSLTAETAKWGGPLCG
jgi:hypothetical protein